MPMPAPTYGSHRQSNNEKSWYTLHMNARRLTLPSVRDARPDDPAVKQSLFMNVYSASTRNTSNRYPTCAFTAKPLSNVMNVLGSATSCTVSRSCHPPLSAKYQRSQL